MVNAQGRNGQKELYTIMHMTIVSVKQQSKVFSLGKQDFSSGNVKSSNDL